MLLQIVITNTIISVSRNFGYHSKCLIMLIQWHTKFWLTDMIVLVITVIVTSKSTQYTVLYDSNVFEIGFKMGQYSDNRPTLYVFYICA